MPWIAQRCLVVAFCECWICWCDQLLASKSWLVLTQDVSAKRFVPRLQLMLARVTVKPLLSDPTVPRCARKSIPQWSRFADHLMNWAIWIDLKHHLQVLEDDPLTGKRRHSRLLDEPETRANLIALESAAPDHFSSPLVARNRKATQVIWLCPSLSRNGGSDLNLWRFYWGKWW